MNLRVANKRQLTNMLLIVVSVLLIALGCFHIYQNNQFMKSGVKTQAVVVNVLRHPQQAEGQSDGDYKLQLQEYKYLLEDYKRQGIIDKDAAIAIIIEYEYDGKEYTTDLGYFSEELSIASTVTIYLSKSDPTKFMYEGANQFGLYFCMVVGSTMLLFSLIFFFIQKYNMNANKLLIEKGKLLKAEIIYADEEENKSSFNKHPFVFTCVYKDEETNEQVYFTSESVYCKNAGLTYIGQKLDVYVDPNNYKNYYIDLKFFD